MNGWLLLLRPVAHLPRRLLVAGSCQHSHSNVHCSCNDTVTILLKIETLDGFERLVIPSIIKEWGRKVTAVIVEKINILMRVVQSKSGHIAVRHLHAPT